MRFKADKKHFTKAERRFVRLLQENHIPFKAKIKINDREIDFLIGKYAIDVDGHSQDQYKNKSLLEAGYSPIHFDNLETKNPCIIKKLCL
jgi:hypothetical protein